MKHIYILSKVHDAGARMILPRGRFAAFRKFNPSEECAATKGTSTLKTDDTIENNSTSSSSSSLRLLHSMSERNPQGDKQADSRFFKFKTAGIAYYKRAIKVPASRDNL